MGKRDKYINLDKSAVLYKQEIIVQRKMGKWGKKVYYDLRLSGNI